MRELRWRWAVPVVTHLYRVVPTPEVAARAALVDALACAGA